VKKLKIALLSASVCLGFGSLSVAAPAKVSSTPASAAAFTPVQVEALHGIIKTYLVKHPEVLAESAEALKMKQRLAMQKMQQQAIAQNKQAIFNDPNSPSMGAKKPTVYLVEFFDYQCGHCKAMKGPIDGLLKANPGLKVIFKEFPIFGKNSEVAARVALAANLQGKYWPVHEALLASGNPMSEAKALAAAKKAGCNMRKLKKDMVSNKVTQALASSAKLAEGLRLQGTPALIFANAKQQNTQLIPGGMPQQMMQALINKQKDSNA
jgi:protein-disulfide isomerase